YQLKKGEIAWTTAGQAASQVSASVLTPFIEYWLYGEQKKEAAKKQNELHEAQKEFAYAQVRLEDMKTSILGNNPQGQEEVAADTRISTRHRRLDRLQKNPSLRNDPEIQKLCEKHNIKI